MHFPENQCHSQWVAVRNFTKGRRVAKQAVIGLGNTKRRVSATDIEDLHWTFKVLTANRQPIGNRTGLQSTKMQIQLACSCHLGLLLLRLEAGRSHEVLE